MDNKELIKKLKTIYETPNSKKKTRFLRTIASPNISLFSFIKNQFKLINKKIYACSLLYFVVLLILLLNSKANQYILLAAGIPFFSVLIIGTINASSVYKMEEIEMATLFSLKMVIIARLLIMSFITVLFIGIMAISTSLVGSKPFIQIVCFFFVPYFLNMYLDLKLLRKYRKDGLKYCFAASSVICLLIISLTAYPSVLSINNSLFIGFGAILLVLTIKEIINYIDRIEEYVWNLQ